MLIMVFISTSLVLAKRKQGSITERVAHGAFVPQVAVTARDLRNLPVPNMQESYAILQCVDNYTNIIIGRFDKGDRMIVLIQDWNSDGTVDLVVYWDADRDLFNYEPHPEKKYKPERFTELKKEILEGKQKDMKPNPEGTPYLLSLLKEPTNISRWYKGFRVRYTDPDRSSFEMFIYSFSFDANGADLVYQVDYRYEGRAVQRPFINTSVYCYDAKDPFIIQYTRDLIKKAEKAYSK